MTLRHALLAVLLALVVCASPAAAADPATGSVDQAHPKLAWTGQITSFPEYTANNGGAGAPCAPQTCDEFSFELKDAAVDLNIKVEDPDASAIGFTLTLPDGSSQWVGGSIKIKKPATGTYTVDTVANESTQSQYKGTVVAGYPAAAPAASAPAAVAPAPATAPPPALRALTTKARSTRKLTLKLESTGPVNQVAVAVIKGRKVVGRVVVSRLAGRGAAVIKLRRKLKPGRYALALSGTDDAGRAVSGSGTLTLRT
jgi:hypothetical protein